MPETDDGLTVLTPAPLEDERRPLLDTAAGQPNHGTIQETPEGLEGNVPAVDEPSTKKIVLIMACMWLGSFLAALDSTIVATLASPMSTYFHSSTLLSWIASGYLIANAAIQPLSGRLTDIFGRKSGLMFACTFFAAGTLICGLAQNAPMLIAGRVIAGMGGGCLNTIGVFIASDLIPLRKRGLWQGFGNIVYGSGMGLGGVFGGFVNDRLDWRWAFYVQVPFIVLCGVLGSIFVNVPIKDSDKSRLRRVDFSGAILLSTSLILLLLGLNSGGNLVPWSHPLVLASLPLAAVAFIGFVVVEDRLASEPIIPVRLLLHRTVAAACLTNWFEAMAQFAMYYYVPIYLQTVIGYSTTAAGVRMIPAAIGASIGSLATGLVMRATGKYWYINLTNQTLLVLSVVLIAATFKETLAVWPPYVILLMNGIAYGSMLTTTLLALLAAVGHEFQAVVTSASYAFRSTGSTIGITLASAVFQNILKRRLWDQFGGYENAAEIIRSIRDDIGNIDHLPVDWKEGVRQIYLEALQGVFGLIVGLAVLGAICALFIKQHTLHAKLDRK